MLEYTLRYADDSDDVQEVTFFAHSTGGALDTAKRAAEGSWAELYEGKNLICRLRLVERTGVWLVSPEHSR